MGRISKDVPFTVERLKQIWNYDKDTGKFMRVDGFGNALEEGAISTQGYRFLTVRGTQHLAHRLAWYMSYGEWPSKRIEHINGDRLDNRLSNLRLIKTVAEKYRGDVVLTPERVRELVHYDQDSGVFTWRVSTSPRSLAGTRAGTKIKVGYRIASIDGVKVLEHRLAWFYIHGVWPKHYIDHANGIKDDNRLSNLRLATNAENTRNSPVRSTNKSGLKGVSWSSRRKKWHARIVKNYRTYVLGYFDNIEDAAQAYQDAARRLHGEFANFSNTKGNENDLPN